MADPYNDDAARDGFHGFSLERGRILPTGERMKPRTVVLGGLLLAALALLASAQSMVMDMNFATQL